MTTAHLENAPSINFNQFPLGSTVVDEGTVFKVWAPHAEQVFVCGDFNEWADFRHPMEANERAEWCLFIPKLGEGVRYKYRIVAENGDFMRADPRGRKMINSVGDTLTWRTRSKEIDRTFEPPEMNEAVIYEMHIGTFNRETPEEVGTFHAAIEKLDYLRELGINVVELMPVSEFAGDLSWGYNPAYPFCVEGAYGGPEGLLEFVREAHARGIAVIIDVVYNHFGPSDLDMWQFDGWSENGLGGIYFYNDWRANTPWGDCRPDYGREEVRAYIKDNALMWFEEYGIDGLRWDMTLYIRTCGGNDPFQDGIAEGWSLMQWINQEIHERYPRAITISEDLRDEESIVQGVESGGAGFSAQWDASFVHPVRNLVITAEDEDRCLDDACRALLNQYAGDAFKRVIYSESHDEVANGKARVPTEVDAQDAQGYFAKKRSVLAAAMVLTSPGIPMLFQGQEFLEDEYFRDEVPLDWSKSGTFSGLNQLYQDLIALRRNHSGFSAGLKGANAEVVYINHQQKLLGYRRWLEGSASDDVIVLLNFSNQVHENIELAVPSGGQWHLRLNSDSQLYDESFEDLSSPPCLQSIAKEGLGHVIEAVRVSAYGFVIYSQDV